MFDWTIYVMIDVTCKHVLTPITLLQNEKSFPL